MGTRNRQRIKDIKAHTRLPYRDELGEQGKDIMSQLTNEQRLRGLGLLSVTRKLPSSFKTSRYSKIGVGGVII